MEDYLKFIYQNYTQATRFEEYWFAFENYMDHDFPHGGTEDRFWKRAQRFEDHLKQVLVHEAFGKWIYRLPEARGLAELEPRIFRETNKDTSSHDKFASDYSRLALDQKPKEPIARLVNLLYTVRCNSQHGQKILPEEWEDIRRRNEQVLSLTTPLLALLCELLITQFVALGVFSYGTLQEASEADFSCEVERYQGLRIKGHLYDMGRFPAWRYNTWGWVSGTVLSAPSQFRFKHIKFCDEVEGDQFERRLVLAYDQNANAQHIVWAYHFVSEPDFKTKINNGVWKSSNKTDVGDS